MKRIWTLLFLLYPIFAFPYEAETDSLLHIYKNLKGKEKADALIKIGIGLRKSSVDSAWLFQKEALELCEQLNYEAGKGKCLYLSGRLKMMKKETDQAMVELKQALQIGKDTKTKSLVQDCYGGIITILQNAGDTAWREVCSEAMDYAKATNDFLLMGKVERDIGTGEYYLGDSKKAIQHFQAAIPYFEKAGDLNFVAGMNMNSGIMMYKMGDYEGSIKAYRGAEKVFFQLKDSNNYARCIENIAITLENSGKVKEAIPEFERAIKIYLAMGNQVNAASCKENLAVAFRKMGKDDLAMKFMLETVKMREEIGDLRDMAISYVNMADLYGDMLNTKLQLEYLNKALSANRGVGDRLRESSVLNIMAGYYRVQKEYKTALAYSDSALAIRREFENLLEIANSLNSRGHIYLDMKEYKEADRCYSEALKLFSELGIEGDIMGTRLNLASVQMNTRKYAEAIVNFRLAYEYFRTNGNLLNSQEALDGLATSYAGVGDYKNAYLSRDRWATIEDSLHNAKLLSKLSEMTLKYDTDAKEQALALSKLELEKKDDQVRTGSLIRNISISAVVLLLIAGFFVMRNYREKRAALVEVEMKNKIIEEKNKDITDSIRYAQHIQEAIMPPQDRLYELLKECFVLYLPKDIVSGDFYWVHANKDQSVSFAAIDCTGHGVPGAFMSVLAHSALTRVVDHNDLNRPSLILNYLNDAVKETFRQHAYSKTVADGMDLAMVTFDRAQGKLQFAGARNPLVVVKKSGEFVEIKGDKQYISGEHDHLCAPFTHHEMKMEKGDMIYLFSDGYADQFGGVDGKKFKYSRLKELLAKVAMEPVHKQRAALEASFKEWKGDLEQVDDILVIGVKA